MPWKDEGIEKFIQLTFVAGGIVVSVVENITRGQHIFLMLFAHSVQGPRFAAGQRPGPQPRIQLKVTAFASNTCFVRSPFTENVIVFKREVPALANGTPAYPLIDGVGAVGTTLVLGLKCFIRANVEASVAAFFAAGGVA